MRWSLFLINLLAYKLIKLTNNFITFSCKICEVFKKTFFGERLLTTTSTAWNMKGQEDGALSFGSPQGPAIIYALKTSHP